MRGFRNRAARWTRANMPTRDDFAANRWLAPIAHRVLHPALWRFTRRSVPRGVALGIFCGFIIPVAQIALAAALSLPLRANVPVAALATFLTNPFTFPFFVVIANRVGEWVLRLDAFTFGAPVATTLANDPGWLEWLLRATGAVAIGYVVMAFVGAAIAHILTAIGWRLWIAARWRARRRRQFRPAGGDGSGPA
jgi:uncharacterized protein (DUF2062 family)